MDKLDYVVIGAGVAGLAVARELTLTGREVFVLEKHPAIYTYCNEHAFLTGATVG